MKHRRIGFWYRFVVVIVKPLLLVFTSRDWRGVDNIPRRGGIIVAANHISIVDPMIIGHFLYDNGRLPRFLAKSTLFTAPVIGRICRGAKQIPVHRGTADAAAALTAAVEALESGECVLIYPEGTATRDPHTWPMVARTGVARLALTSGVPVIPVAQWGAQEILPYPTKRPHLRRTKVHMLAGPPVDLSRFEGKEQTAEILREATDEVMHRITEQLEQLRKARATSPPYDPRRQGEAA